MRIILNMDLLQLPEDAEGQISGFQQELREDFCQRLRELGFREGESVRCIRRIPFGGPRVFMVGGTIFSVESTVARHVLLKKPR